jgi:hypothetical protein
MFLCKGIHLYMFMEINSFHLYFKNFYRKWTQIKGLYILMNKLLKIIIIFFFSKVSFNIALSVILIKN